MSDPNIVRLANIGDAGAIARVHVESWRTTYAGILPDAYLAGLSADAREPIWKGSLSHDDCSRTRFVIVAEVAGEIVGFADGGPARNAPGYDAEIFAVYLPAEYQRQGLGKRLMCDLAEKLITAGHRSAIVGVLADNPSRRFYEKLGARYSHSQELSLAGVKLEECFYTWDDIRVISKSND